MKRLHEILSVLKGWLKRYVSPAFVVLFCASFVLWYVLKLGDTYVTEYNLNVEVSGYEIEVPCTVTAKGTDLLEVRRYQHRSLVIPLEDLEYDIKTKIADDGDSVQYYKISRESMQNEISIRLKQAEIVVGSVPLLPIKPKNSAI
ncbi:MAG: hypothetical protein Q4F45_05810 [Alistipes sp.]|nr:hypothetical protein [Alistipes sp.]